MVARLLSLEEAEKQKNQEQEEEIRAAQGYLKSSAAAAKEGSDTGVRVRGEETRGAWTQIESGWREVSRFERLLQNVSDNGDHNGTAGYQNTAAQPKSGYPEAEDARLKDDSRHTGATPSGLSGVVSSTLPIPMLGLKVFGEKSEKAEPVLPASKWTREDGSSDNENEDDKGLGLGYSSDDSEDLTKMDTKGDKPEYTVADSSMDEERRYATNFKLFPVLESHVHLKIYVCQGFHRVVCMCRLLYLSCTTKPFFEPSIILSRATHLPDHL
jgi:hypothetical protein